jgi:hypothetical protein
MLKDEPCWRVVYKASTKKDRYVICPYDENGVLLEEGAFQAANPRTYAYLQYNRDKLAKRKLPKGTPWYAFGRRQGLVVPPVAEVLYIGSITKTPLDYVRRRPTLFSHGLQLVPHSSTEDAKKWLGTNEPSIRFRAQPKRGGWVSVGKSCFGGSAPRKRKR